MRSIVSSLRRSFPFSLRMQVAVWYTIVFAVMLLLTGAVFYKYLENSLETGVDTDLQLRAQQIASDFKLHNSTLTPQDIATILPDVSSTTQAQESSSANVDEGVLIRLLDNKGTLLGETPAFRELRIPTESWTQPLQGHPWQGIVHSAHDQEVRVYSRMLNLQGRPAVVIQVGVSLANLHTLLHSLVAALLIVGFLVLICCAVSSYWLATRSFAPIQRLAVTARKIKAGDLHQRVPVPATRDEVQYLAVTLNEMLDSLEQSFVQQRRFVADASHELRTPVAVIRNKAGIVLLGTPQFDETVTALQEIRTESERLSYLLADLLTLARGDEGQARFEHEEVQLDHLVETVVATTEILADERKITLTVQITSPVTVVGDEARLIQVVMNLLDNAIRYTNPGGQVWVSVEQTPKAARLTVRDNGIGIAPEHLPHIFERFYRTDHARQFTGGRSSGLGLSIVDWIVRMHGGAIDVKSQVGQGSCFIVMLPRGGLLS